MRNETGKRFFHISGRGPEDASMLHGINFAQDAAVAASESQDVEQKHDAR